MNQLKDVNYLSDIIRVIEAVGGVPSAVCASFLSKLEVYDEDIGLVARTNNAKHKCVLFPIAGLFSSALILKISASMILCLLDFIKHSLVFLVLDNPNLLLFLYHRCFYS